MAFTVQQQAVIDTRHKDILVAAAAGSGKTTVLVERIIRSVLQGDPPVDIDRILVVTFTRAAAKEMKERIYRRLSKAAEQHPEDKRIAAQTMLVFHAQISTIDGFCQYVIKNYFHEIAIDPNMRIADEGELLLLSHEVLEEVLEDAYAKGDESFLSFADSFAKRDKDTAIEDMILSLYSKATAHPWTDEWLDELTGVYEAASVEELMEYGWVEALYEQAKRLLTEYRNAAKNLLAEVEGHPYEQTLVCDVELLDSLAAARDYRELQQRFCGMQFARLAAKKAPGEDLAVRERYKERRTRIKTDTEKLRDDLFYKTAEELFDEMQKNAPRVKALVALTKEFHARFAEKKRDRNVMDFSDLEHFALDILIDKNTKKRTKSAKALSQYFSEVMVDEYQDTNYLQEMILRAVTREEEGTHNYFMVGDVKQSIYRFRQAQPEIFTEKYRMYSEENDEHVRIDLDRNFRSRSEVTDAVNNVFAAVMHADCGGVEYDEAASLKCAAADYPNADPASFTAELLLADAQDDDAEAGMESDDEREATMIALRIRKILSEGYVTDAKTGRLRRVHLSDIAVLHRSANKNGGIFVDTFAKYDIAAHMASSTGYFNTVEVETVLSLLSVLNNPCDDIPLASVLFSPMFGFSNEELLLIRGKTGGSFFEAFFAYAKEHEKEEKVVKFISFLTYWRGRLFDTSIAEILEGVLKETGYLSYVTAMPGGDGRRANLLKLIDLAITYEKTSFRGLFYFVRYIERLKSYEQDFGTAQTVSENDDAVTVMTIHKSKGLEFPIVIVAGLGKRFNNSTAATAVHERYGVGMDLVDIIRRTKSRCVYKSFINRMNRLEERGEELRILYVAMTRAKEKLILSGVIKDVKKELQKMADADGALDLGARLSARHYLDLLLPVVLPQNRHISFLVYNSEDLVVELLAEEIERSDRKQELLLGVESIPPEAVAKKKRNMQFIYPHKRSIYKTKYSVSEIKHKVIDEIFANEVTVNVFETEEKRSIVPEFIRGKQETFQGALRGTAVHRFMECFDFARDDYADAYEDEKKRMTKAGLLTEDQVRLLSGSRIKAFLQSDLAKRMHMAAKSGRLYKEKAFVCGGNPGEFFDDADADEDELILVQGIIDVFFIEDDGIVLMDYKTDHVDSPEELLVRYEKQLALYQDAIERRYELPVKERILYSFTFGEVRSIVGAK